MPVLCSPHPLCFWVAQREVSQFMCHFYIWRSGQDGPSWPSWLSVLLLTDSSGVPQESQGYQAVVEVLAFKFQLHAQPWHIVSMYSFQFHGTFLLVLPANLVLPSSPLFVNTAENYISRLSPVIPDPMSTVWFPGSFHGRTWACTSALCVHSHPGARQLSNTKAVTGHFATAPTFERYLG